MAGHWVKADANTTKKPKAANEQAAALLADVQNLTGRLKTLTGQHNTVALHKASGGFVSGDPMARFTIQFIPSGKFVPNDYTPQRIETRPYTEGPLDEEGRPLQCEVVVPAVPLIDAPEKPDFSTQTRITPAAQPDEHKPAIEFKEGEWTNAKLQEQQSLESWWNENASAEPFAENEYLPNDPRSASYNPKLDPNYSPLTPMANTVAEAKAQVGPPKFSGAKVFRPSSK